MDAYSVLECLGKGAQGTVYLAENRQDPDTKWAMKKIECHDESEANEAYRQALELQKLNHPYVCKYKDFFVTWEKSTSSIYLCIVTQYYGAGDLKSVIKSYQDKKEAISEELVKKYLGEILEGLIFVYKKGVTHRDLKPSNIFIQEDETVCLGDFGVATVMADAYTNTRNSLCTKNYMAPEVGQISHDEKSDIWALGCILFELCTTFLYNAEEVYAKMKEIKEEPLVLEDVFEEVANHFSGELILVIRCMLKLQHAKRKSIAELCEIKYIKDCLEMADIYILDKKRRQKESGDSVSTLSPDSPGLLIILEHIAKSIDHEEQVREGLNQLVTLTQGHDGVLLDDRGKKLVAMAMRNNVNDKEIQLAGCNIFNNIVLKASPGDIMFKAEIISVIPVAMKKHTECVVLLESAISLLLTMSDDGEASVCIGELGVIEDILTAMRTHPDNPDICSICCRALWSLAVQENNLLIAANQKALKDVCIALKRHMTNTEMCEAAAAAIVSLSLEDSVYEYINDIGCVGLLILAMSTHIRHPKVIKNTCLALSGIVESDEECAYLLLTSEDTDGCAGIPVIIKSYQQHKDNAEVVESLVNLIVQLAAYDDVNAELRYLSVGPNVLSEVYKRFKPTREIMSPCEKALDLLGNKQQKVTN